MSWGFNGNGISKSVAKTIATIFGLVFWVFEGSESDATATEEVVF